ncbi:hypothetical protein [Chryseobacterium sp. KCF3-3]|uniref:hypothetical protein n=1 Tax=Chryseobacterium sp. KCF3-3 TaxID=3231511 RepID=UPI0038B272F7
MITTQMNEMNYKHLLGKIKKDVLKELGDEFNYYSSNVWNYTLKTSFFGKKTILVLYFADDKVIKWDVVKSYK